jgi:CheY-like chemotaxis protein
VGRYSERARVLIVCDDEVDRDTLRVFVGTMGYQWMVASNLDEAVEILNREPTAAAILDSRHLTLEAGQENRSLREVLMRLPGRIIVLTKETSGDVMSEIARRYSLPIIQRERIAQDIWSSLETLLHPSTAMQRITEAARLVMDTLLMPLPEGIRNSRMDKRQLVYESESVTADISLEPRSESILISLVGQILRKTEPRRPLGGVSVVVEGREGLLGSAMTNEWGEFSYQMKSQPIIALELVVNPNHWVKIVLPELNPGSMDACTREEEPRNRKPSEAVRSKLRKIEEK